MPRRILLVVAAILACSTSLSAQKQKEISLISWTLFRPALDKPRRGFASRSIDAVTRRRNDGHPREGSRWSAGTPEFSVVAGSERGLCGAQHGDRSVSCATFSRREPAQMLE